MTSEMFWIERFKPSARYSLPICVTHSKEVLVIMKCGKCSREMHLSNQDGSFWCATCGDWATPAVSVVERCAECGMKDRLSARNGRMWCARCGAYAAFDRTDIVKCTQCGANNAIKPDQVGQPVCENCKTRLPANDLPKPPTIGDRVCPQCKWALASYIGSCPTCGWIVPVSWHTTDHMSRRQPEIQSQNEDNASTTDASDFCSDGNSGGGDCDSSGDC